MAYATTQAHLLDELERIECLLDEVAKTRPSDESQASGSDSDLASPNDANEGATATLRQPTPIGESTGPPEEFSLALPAESHDRLEAHRERIDRRCRETSPDTTLRVRLLEDRFDLTAAHRDVLLLALAPEIDDAYGAALREVNTDVMLPRPTLRLVEQLFGTSETDRLAASELVGPASPLRRHGLITLEEPPDTTTSPRDRPIEVTERIIEYLKGHRGLDGALTEYADLREPATTMGDLRVEAPVRARLEELSDGLSSRTIEGERSSDRPARLLYFHGPEGCGKCRAVEAMTDGRILAADLRAIVEAGLLRRFHREALLQNCPVHLTNVIQATTEGLDPAENDRADASLAGTSAPQRGDRPSLDEVVDAITPLAQPCFLTGTDRWTPTSGSAGTEVALVEFPMPGTTLRSELWEARSDVLGPEVDPRALASTFRLTQGQIDDAIETARALTDDVVTDELPRDAVVEGCKTQSARTLDSLAERIEPSADWSNLVLPPKTERQLKQVAAHVTQRGTVYESWGFEDRFSRGTGVVALFSGPSGTGKTLAAEVIAEDAGMDLYKIDLSSVVSKYIGETEQNLERIFDAARDSNAILLFDEADAVFGERAGVSDATDRYANVEVNFLLQRIESYDGIVLLTTNFESHIDDAFMRRIHQSVSFRRPDDDAREDIWRGIFPADTPTRGIDFERLADLELTGGNIRNVAQTAAVLAAAEDSHVEMCHVVEAVRREYDKLDKMLDPSVLGEYSSLLDSPKAGTSAGDDSEVTEWSEDTAPEQTIEAFFERLDEGDRDGVNALYHPRTVADRFSDRELAMMATGSLSIGDIERVRDDPDRVIVQFAQKFNGEKTRLESELRPEAGEWQIFDLGPVQH